LRISTEVQALVNFYSTVQIDKCRGQVQELYSDQDIQSMGIDLALRIQPYQENH